MLTVNTSAPKRVYTTPKSIIPFGEMIYLDIADTTTVGRWFDLSNKYFYVVRSVSAAPWLKIERWTYDTNGVFGSKTDITLSGFGTFTAAPRLTTFQGSANGNFYLICSGDGGSANFVQDDVCTVSISGTTATKGSNLSVPAVGSYQLNRAFAVGAVVYAFYSLTASPFTCDVGRKYSGSWSTLTTTALPTTVGTVEDDTRDTLTNTTEVYGGGADLQKLNTVGAGSNRDKFYHSFVRANYHQCLKFDAATDTWTVAPYIFDQVFGEINGSILFHNKESTRTTILNSSLTKVGELNGLLYGAQSNSLLQGPIIDLVNGIWEHSWGNSSIGKIQFFSFFKGVAKRLGKLICSNIAGVGVVYQIDSGDWGSYIPVSTNVVQELDYYGETSISVFFLKTTGTAALEITD